VDGGAYNGDSALNFVRKMKSVGKTAKRCYLFEPSAENLILTDELKSHSDFEFIYKGLHGKEQTLYWWDNKQNPAGSRFVDEGTALGYRHSGENIAQLPVTSIDAIFDKLPDSELPTFIKLDVEGCEKDALLGATNTIKRGKPKLAICAYHRDDDLFMLPRTLLNIRNDYKLTLRQHMFGYWDTVLYAV
jgi:FkbM family methyltransferase